MNLFSKTIFIGVILGVSACSSVPDEEKTVKVDPTALGYVQPYPDGTDPQIHKSSRSGAEGVFEEGVFFCRNALTEVQRGRGFQRGEQLRKHAAEFGFGLGPQSSEAVVTFAGQGNTKIFAGRADTRVLAVINYDTNVCTVLAFNAPNADAGHRRILDLRITSAEPMPVSRIIYPEGTDHGRWCYREPSMFQDNGKELIISGGATGEYGITAAARYSVSEECAPGA